MKTPMLTLVSSSEANANHTTHLENDHPSRACAKGFHFTAGDALGVSVCVWCGTRFRSTALALQPITGEPSSNPLGGTTVKTSAQPVVGCNVSEFEQRFQAMAQEYAANSPQLRHWVQQGNTLPSVYR